MLSAQTLSAPTFREEDLEVHLLFAAICVLADQITKYFAFTRLRGQPPVEVLEGVFRLTYTENMGASFGILQGKRIFFLVFTMVVIALLLYFLIRYRNAGRLFCWALSLLLAGGVGNFIDRFRNGYVVDFLEFTFVSFPVFNIADICVTCGAILLCIYVIFSGRDVKKP